MNIRRGKEKEGFNYQTPTHKVGIKILHEQQLMNIFPDYENLLHKIEVHRKVISNLQITQKEHYQYNLMYDNVFSILGKRGSGKTSVAFTIKENILHDQKHPYDQVLPIIMPEMIPDIGNTIGWILAIVREEIIKLEKKFLQLRKDIEKEEYWQNCKCFDHENQNTLLSKKVNDLMELYLAGKYNPSSERSYYTAIGNSAKQTENYYQFSKQINELWDEWVENLCTFYLEKQKINGNKAEKQVYPLIYFIFDDVDLAPERVEELLSIIIKYLSHPNIIVLVSADEELFLEVIENNLDKNIGRLPKEWRHFLENKSRESDNIWVTLHKEQIENQEVISQTARRYLGKVLPPSTRYYLRLFNSCEQKQMFRINNKSSLSKEIIILIDKLLHFLKVETPNFMKPKNTEVGFYMYFFGDTSRQIGNTFIGIQELVESLIKILSKDFLNENDYIDMIYSQCQHFMYIAINANHEIAEEIDRLDNFMQEIIIKEQKQWKIFLNYPYLKDYLEKLQLQKYENITEQLIKFGMAMYSLMFFVENIVILLESNNKYHFRKRNKVHGMPHMTSFITDMVFDGRKLLAEHFTLNEFLLHYEKLLSRLPLIIQNKHTRQKIDRDYFYDFLDYEYKSITLSDLMYYYEQDDGWFREIVERVSLMYGNVYLIGTKEIKKSALFREENVQSRYQKYLNEMMIDEVMKLLKRLSVLEVASEKLQEITLLKKIQITKSNRLQSMLEEIKEEVHREGLYLDAYMPISYLLAKVNDRLDNMDLVSIVKLCPISLQENILKEEHIENLIYSMSNPIEGWDNYCIDVFFYNEQDFLTNLNILQNKLIGKERTMIEELKKVVLKLNSKNRKFSSIRYFKLKKILENINSYISKQSENDNFIEDIDTMKVAYNELLNGFDGSCSLEKTNKNWITIEDVVELGITSYLLKKFQIIYLSQIILEKYQNENERSSRHVEYFISKKDGDRSKKPSYYYAMFKLIKEIYCNNLTKTKESFNKNSLNEIRENEGKWTILKRVISQSVSKAHYEYIQILLNGRLE